MRIALSTALVTAALMVLGASARNGHSARPLRDPCCWFPRDRRDCTTAEARLLVVNFTRAFNAGNRRRLDRIFAKEPAFHWYSTGKPGARFDVEAENRSTLMRYFARRHRHHERLELLQWRGGQTPGGEFGFGFIIRRRTDTLRPTAFEGKGALYCARRGNRIIVWSTGARVEDLGPPSP